METWAYLKTTREIADHCMAHKWGRLQAVQFQCPPASLPCWSPLRIRSPQIPPIRDQTRDPIPRRTLPPPPLPRTLRRWGARGSIACTSETSSLSSSPLLMCTQNFIQQLPLEFALQQPLALPIHFVRRSRFLEGCYLQVASAYRWVTYTGKFLGIVGQDPSDS